MADRDLLSGGGGFALGSIFALGLLFLAAAMMSSTSCLSLNKQPQYQSSVPNQPVTGTPPSHQQP